MLDVKIQADTVYGDDYEETDTYYIAEVNGTRWTQAQTEQAIRDALVCRCSGHMGDCACCMIKSKYMAVTQNERQV